MRDLSHSVEMTWSAPRRSSLNVIDNTRCSLIANRSSLTAVFTLKAFIVYSFLQSFSMSFLGAKRTKNARHSKISHNNLLLRSCKQHPSVGCCLPFTAFRSSIGGKRTRFSHINSNAINTAQTSFALFPMLKRLFAIILTVPVLFLKLHLFAKCTIPMFQGDNSNADTLVYPYDSRTLR